MYPRCQIIEVHQTTNAARQHKAYLAPLVDIGHVFNLPMFVVFAGLDDRNSVQPQIWHIYMRAALQTCSRTSMLIGSPFSTPLTINVPMLSISLLVASISFPSQGYEMVQQRTMIVKKLEIYLGESSLTCMGDHSKYCSWT